MEHTRSSTAVRRLLEYLRTACRREAQYLQCTGGHATDGCGSRTTTQQRPAGYCHAAGRPDLTRPAGETGRYIHLDFLCCNVSLQIVSCIYGTHHHAPSPPDGRLGPAARGREEWRTDPGTAYSRQR